MAPTDDDAELAALRAENAQLRSLLAAAPAPAPTPVRRSRAWVIPSAALIVLGAVLAPLAIVSSWAGREVSSTDAFVATFAPLARDAAVRSLVASKTTAAIEEHVDVAGITGSVFDGIGQLDLPPRAKSALTSLQGPATAGLEDLISSTVTKFVDSDAFQTLWQGLLRTGHTQMVASLTGARNADVAIGEDGSIGIQLGPVVAQVKTLLVDRGLTFASRIPDVNRTIVVATSDAAVRAQTGYVLVQATATWLPWAAAACIAAGVLMARRRSRALALGAVGVAVAALVTIAALGIGRIVAVNALAPALMPRNAARTIYDAVTAFVLSASVAVTVLALCVALVAWFAGSSRPAVRIRGAFGSAAAGLRGWAEGHGITTGVVGEQLYRFRGVVRVLIGLGAAAIIALHRPLQPGLIVWTLVGSLVAVAVVELVARPGTSRPAAGPTGAAAHPGGAA